MPDKITMFNGTHFGPGEVLVTPELLALSREAQYQGMGPQDAPLFAYPWTCKGQTFLPESLRQRRDRQLGELMSGRLPGLEAWLGHLQLCELE